MLEGIDLSTRAFELRLDSSSWLVRAFRGYLRVVLGFRRDQVLKSVARSNDHLSPPYTFHDSMHYE